MSCRLLLLKRHSCFPIPDKDTVPLVDLLQVVKVLLSRRLFLAEALVLDDGHQLLAGRREQQVRPLNELGDIEELLVVLVEVESSLCLSKLNKL